MHQIIVSLIQVLASGELARHMLTTLMRFLTGYLIASVIAVSAGIVLGYFPFGHSLLDTSIELLRPMPSVAIIPVAILLLGISDGMIVAVTVYASLWPILINTIDGVRNIDRVLLHTARTFGLSPWRTIWQVILPACSPQIMTGLRVSLPITLILVVISEMVGSTDGIGYFILDAQRRFRVIQMYAGMLALAILGYVLNQLFGLLHRWLLSWHWGLAQRRG
jgi:sulfonate transport system permease protein